MTKNVSKNNKAAKTDELFDAALDKVAGGGQSGAQAPKPSKTLAPMTRTDPIVIVRTSSTSTRQHW